MGRCLDPIKETERRRKIGLSLIGNKRAVGYELNEEQKKKQKRGLVKAHGKKEFGFLKGHIPWHKDKRIQLNTGRTHFKKGHHSRTEFKKGQRPSNWIDGRSKTKEYKCELTRRRKIKKLKLGGFHTFQEWFDLKEKYHFICPACKKKEPFKNQYFKELTEDHIVPIDEWENWIKLHPEIDYLCDDIENIQPLCHSCNSIKYTKIIKYSLNFYANSLGPFGGISFN